MYILLFMYLNFMFRYKQNARNVFFKWEREKHRQNTTKWIKPSITIQKTQNRKWRRRSSKRRKEKKILHAADTMKRAHFSNCKQTSYWILCEHKRAHLIFEYWAPPLVQYKNNETRIYMYAKILRNFLLSTRRNQNQNKAKHTPFKPYHTHSPSISVSIHVFFRSID